MTSSWSMTGGWEDTEARGVFGSRVSIIGHEVRGAWRKFGGWRSPNDDVETSEEEAAGEYEVRLRANKGEVCVSGDFDFGDVVV